MQPVNEQTLKLDPDLEVRFDSSDESNAANFNIEDLPSSDDEDHEDDDDAGTPKHDDEDDEDDDDDADEHVKTSLPDGMTRLTRPTRSLALRSPSKRSTIHSLR